MPNTIPQEQNEYHDKTAVMIGWRSAGKFPEGLSRDRPENKAVNHRYSLRRGPSICHIKLVLTQIISPDQDTGYNRTDTAGQVRRNLRNAPERTCPFRPYPFLRIHKTCS